MRKRTLRRAIEREYKKRILKDGGIKVAKCDQCELEYAASIFKCCPRCFVESFHHKD